MTATPTAPILSPWLDGTRVSLAEYEAAGGYAALKKAVASGGEAVVAEVKKANLRGRGGAGFPAGVKWGFLPNDGRARVLVVNADEGEPGTFKDRVILSKAPHLLLEGIAIAAFALKATTAYVYIRGEFVCEAAVVGKAIAEAEAKGYLGASVAGSGHPLKVSVYRGAGAYICGEETSLLNSLEGKRGWPRLKPPFPALVGAFGLPTIINNVETLANVPWIVEHGGDAFAAVGCEKNGGTRLIGVSGHVNKPGVYEVACGTPLRRVVEEMAGGVSRGRKLKAVIPGGSSSPVLRPDEIDVTIDVESMAKAGTMAGSGGIIVMAEGTCLVRALSVLLRFYAHESCGQCSPCREGTAWLSRVVSRIEAGQGKAGDVDLALEICDTMAGRTICPLSDAAAMPAKSFIGKFRDEFERHVATKACPFGNRFA